MTTASRVAISILVAAVWAIGLATGSGLAIQNPWVREPPPGATVLAAYLTLTNRSGSAQMLVGVSSPLFERIEIHQTVERDGTVRMVRQERLEVPPGGQVIFSPGGHHLMLIGPSATLHEGDSVDLRLELEGGDAVEVSAPVRRGAPDPHEHHTGAHAH